VISGQWSVVSDQGPVVIWFCSAVVECRESPWPLTNHWPLTT